MAVQTTDTQAHDGMSNLLDPLTQKREVGVLQGLDEEKAPI